MVYLPRIHVERELTCYFLLVFTQVLLAQRVAAFVLFFVEREYSRNAKANANTPKPTTISVKESIMLTYLFFSFAVWARLRF